MPPVQSLGAGVFSMHTWIAVKPSGAPRYARYEVLGFGVAKGSVW